MPETVIETPEAVVEVVPEAVSETVPKAGPEAVPEAVPKFLVYVTHRSRPRRSVRSVQFD